MASGSQIPTGTPSAGAPRDDNRPGSWASRTTGWRGVSWGWWTALIVAVVAIVVIGAAILIGANGSSTMTTRSVMQIVQDPEAYTGERVVVTGRIDELLTDRALVLGSDLTDQGVLVLIEPAATIGGYGVGTGITRPLPAGQTYDRGDVVQFAGTLRDFDRQKLSDELGLVLNDELFDQWQGKPALVADRLDVATVGLQVATPQPS